MAEYLVRRLLIAIPTMFVIVALSFLLIRAAPGGPFDEEAALEPQVIENLSAAYHLDKPVSTQFVIYLGNVLRGDLGPSMIYKDFTVNELLMSGLPVSASLGLKALALAVLLGGCLGIVAALNQNRALDFGVMSLSMCGIAIPSFVLAPLLTLVFGIYLKELSDFGATLALPVAGWGGFRYQVLPIIALALPQVAIVARLTRASMIEVLRSNFVRAARLRGLSEVRVVTRHALRAAILPVVSYLGPAIAGVVTGSLIVEQVFDLPGIGRYFTQGAINRDYPLVMGVVIVYAATVLILNLIVDLLYGVLDPKVRIR